MLRSLIVLLVFVIAFPFYAAASGLPLTKACKHPSGSYKKSRGVHSFTLENGMVGGCKSSDRKPRVRSNGEVEPFKERVEVASRVLKGGKRYSYTQWLRFDPEASSGPRTTFFQIHQHGPNKSCKPNPGPALMMQLDRGKVQFNLKISGSTKDSSKNYRQVKTAVTRIHLTEWTQLDVRFDTTKDQLTDVSVALNGRVVLKDRIWFTGCGTPYIRTGLYRPGTNNGQNPTDRYWVKDAELVVLN